jgi:hypothetical protein
MIKLLSPPRYATSSWKKVYSVKASYTSRKGSIQNATFKLVKLAQEAALKMGTRTKMRMTWR